MSALYGTMKGNRGEHTCCATPQSGIEAHLCSWHGGVRAVIERHKWTKSKVLQYVCRVYQTGGTNGPGKSDKIAEFYIEP
jgi:hypothetical protein